MNDGFRSMLELLTHYEDDIDGFSEYIKNINKTFGGLTHTRMVFFNPVVTSHIVGAVHY